MHLDFVCQAIHLFIYLKNAMAQKPSQNTFAKAICFEEWTIDKLSNQEE